jgi:hypothetical protein
MELLLSGQTVKSYFELLGTNEDDMTYALGWTLSKSETFCTALLEKITWPPGVLVSHIRLQQHEKDRGFTDIELISSFGDAVIVEAKKGWTLPGTKQLSKYRKRESFSDAAKYRALVVLTAFEEKYTASVLEKSIDGVAIIPLSWATVLAVAQDAHRLARRNKEKWVLDELVTYLEGIVLMERLESNRVFVVSLSGDNFSNDPDISWTEVVSEYQQYFHPLGVRGWPSEPPNYIGFRYNGRLQSVHHIDGYRVINSWSEFDGRLHEDTEEPIFLYDLGDPIPLPDREIRSGKIRNARLWCHLDLLLTSDTVQEASRLSRLRMGEDL